MFLAFTTSFDCRRPAFWLERTVTKPTVCCAGQELADHLVGATRNKAWAFATAVFGTETLANRGSGATRHRARLVLFPAVSDAMLRSVTWTGGATIILACSFSPVLDANTTCMRK